MTSAESFQLYAAIATPFKKNNSVDIEAMVTHAEWLLRVGCDGLVVFGTTGEAVSLTKDERIVTLSALVQRGIPAEKLLTGTGCCAIADTIELSTRAHELGCQGVLIMPPFLFKGLTDEGLLETFRQIIQGVGKDDLNIFLYHFPALSGVSFTASLVNRLKAEFPNHINGYKDSGGDWENTRQIIASCQGVTVYSGSELPLNIVLEHGGAGCISATANTQASVIRSVITAWEDGDAGALRAAQERASANRMKLQGYPPMIAAVKASIASRTGNEGWLNIRPPLMCLSKQDADELVASLDL